MPQPAPAPRVIALRRCRLPPTTLQWALQHGWLLQGVILDEALRDFVSARRDYADAWDERLHRAPNHRHAAALIQYVCVSEDDELLAWASGPDGQPALQEA